jgi:hypothetical protein
MKEFFQMIWEYICGMASIAFLSLCIFGLVKVFIDVYVNGSWDKAIVFGLFIGFLHIMERRESRKRELAKETSQ